MVQGSLDLHVTRGAESWQFFAFIFGACVAVDFALIDDVLLHAWTKLLLHSAAVVIIGYFTLISPWGRDYLVGVLGRFKSEPHERA